MSWAPRASSDCTQRSPQSWRRPRRSWSAAPAHEQALTDAPPLLDAEAETLRLLAELRDTILAGEVGSRPSVLALRRILHHLFERVVYRPAGSDHPVTRIAEYEEFALPTDGAYIEPYLREGVIDRYDEQARPVVERLALPLETEGVGLALLLVTALRVPLPVPTHEPHTSKPCSRCGRVQPLEAFNRNRRARDGRPPTAARASAHGAPGRCTLIRPIPQATSKAAGKSSTRRPPTVRKERAAGGSGLEPPFVRSD